LVTGATGRIGLHITRQFAAQGWTVLVGARDAARGAEVAARFGGRPLLLDVTNAPASYLVEGHRHGVDLKPADRWERPNQVTVIAGELPVLQRLR
jgi:NADP-dependent 3-hydroxy acid dehydrogenase YdfG